MHSFVLVDQVIKNRATRYPFDSGPPQGGSLARLAGRQSEHHFPSRTGRCVVDQPDLDLARLDHPPNDPPRRIQLGQTARRHDQELHRQL